jgi:chaperonin GroES
MTIRPLHDRILAERVAVEEKTSGGIFVPTIAKEKPLEVIIVAVGDGKIGEDGVKHPLEVKVGDRALIGKYQGAEIKIDGKDFVILREEEIMAVVEKDTPA